MPHLAGPGYRHRAQVVLLLGACLAVLGGVAVTVVNPLLGLASVAAAALLIALLRLPVDWLPALALASYALVPVNFLPGRTFTTVFSPALFVILIWFLRARPQGGLTIRTPQFWILGLTLLWFLSGLLSSINVTQSISWVIPFIGLVALPAVGATRLTKSANLLLAEVWVGLGSLLAVGGLIEYLLKENPILDPYYINGNENTPLAQVWSVYRITTTLGHPLGNGTFFALACIYAVHRLASKPTIGGLVIVTLNAMGLTLTVSRSAVIAAACGLTILLASFLVSRRQSIGFKLAVIIVSGAAAAAVWSNGNLQARDSSTEALQSSAVRANVVDVALDAASNFNWLGSGPGTSRLAYNSDIIVENSFLQLLISVGLPGLTFIAAILLAAFFACFRARRYAVIAALTVFLVCAGAYNLMESYRPSLVLLGLILMQSFAISDQEFAEANKSYKSPRTNSSSQSWAGEKTFAR